VFRPPYCASHKRRGNGFPERRIPIVADRSALKRLGLSFAALTLAVALIGAVVVKQHIDSQPTVDVVGSPAVKIATTR